MDKRTFRVGKLKALASARSVGKTIDFRGERITIEELDEASSEGVDIALFSAGEDCRRSGEELLSDADRRVRPG